MKAFYVFEKNGDGGTFVFAENHDKAKGIAIHSDVFNSGWHMPSYTSLRVRRAPDLDEEYRGRDELEWCDDEDRLALIRHGYTCSLDIFLPQECETCVGKDICDMYADYLEESKEETQWETEQK